MFHTFVAGAAITSLLVPYERGHKIGYIKQYNQTVILNDAGDDMVKGTRITSRNVSRKYRAILPDSS